MKTQNQKGFTLVELAIVMTIIGLLIGGILKGQELMENARVTSTIAQIRSFEAATTTFRDTYSAMPGDMTNPDERIPGCGVECIPGGVGTSVAGDGMVGGPGELSDEQNVLAGGATAADEPVLFWAHLMRADLISGITNDGLVAGGVLAPNGTHPAARIGGVFRAGNGGGGAGNDANTGAPMISGMGLVISGAIGGDLNQNAGQQAMSPLRASQIDRRMDDGMPMTGYVRGYGEIAANTGCVDGVLQTSEYEEANGDLDCGLILRIQG